MWYWTGTDVVWDGNGCGMGREWRWYVTGKGIGWKWKGNGVGEEGRRSHGGGGGRGEEGEHHPHHQNGVRHHNGDVICVPQMVRDGTCSKRLDTGYGTGMDVVYDLKWNRMQM